MNSRDRVLAILDRQPVDRLPVDIWHTEEILQALMAHYQADTDLDLYRKIGIDKIVWTFPVYNPADNTGPTGSTHLGHAERSMWGTPLKTMQAGQAVYQEFGDPPLRDCETVADIDKYPLWPDPDRFDYDQMTAVAQNASTDFTVCGPWVSFFEIYCQMRGIERALMDVVANPEFLQAALDRIEDCQTEMMKRFLDQASQWIDMVFVSDDMGCQNSLLMSLGAWDTFFKDRMKRWCDLIHSYRIRVFFHTDGAAGLLIPRLIDAGIDILNPIQHVCPSMDCADLKRRFGQHIIFHGGIENQRILPFGSPEDVRAETRRCMTTLGARREGYIVCSCHNIQPGTPIENIIAMIETVQNEGSLD